MEKTQQLKEAAIKIFGKHEIRCILNANIDKVRDDKWIIVLCDTDEKPLTDAELELFLDTFCVRYGTLAEMSEVVSMMIGAELESRISDFDPKTNEAFLFLNRNLTRLILSTTPCWDNRYTKSIYITFPYWIGVVDNTWVCMDFTSAAGIDTAAYRSYNGRATAIHEGVKLFKKTHPDANK